MTPRKSKQKVIERQTPLFGRTLATVMIAGLIGFLWPMYTFINKIQTFEVMWDPPGVAQLIFAIMCGLAAVAAALKLDLPEVVAGLLPRRG